MAFEQIVFDQEKHSYTVNGQIIPSVTTILSSANLTPDFSVVNRDVLAFRAEVGTKAHQAATYYDLDILNENSVDNDIWGYVEAWKNFRIHTGFEPTEMEMPVYSSKYGYSGTLDRIGMLNNELTIIDLKTSSMVDLVHVGPQTAAYEQAYKDWTNQPNLKIKRAAVKLIEDGTYKFIPCDDKNDLNIFLYALNLNKWKGVKHVCC